MKLIIDIDENVFTRLFDNGIEDYAIVNDDLFKIAKAIRKGTPLPKGHGRLIDVDALQETFIEPNIYLKTNEKGFWCVTCKEIRNAPTIIESDKEE